MQSEEVTAEGQRNRDAEADFNTETQRIHRGSQSYAL
jgi:hypothetical protein